MSTNVKRFFNSEQQTVLRTIEHATIPFIPVDFVNGDKAEIGAFRKDVLVKILKSNSWEISYGMALIPGEEYMYLQFDFDELIQVGEYESFSSLMVYLPENDFKDLESLF